MKPHKQISITSLVGTGREINRIAPNTDRIDKDLVVKDLFNVNNTETQQLHGQKFRRLGIRSSTGESVFSLATNEFLTAVTSLVDAPTIGLPKPQLVGPGKTYIVKDEAGGAASTTITIVSVGEETIDGSTSASISTNYQSKTFYSNGSNWFVI